MACTLLANWDPKYKDPCLIVTDLPPTEADVNWYKLRSWIESEFKDVKSGEFQWQRTRMSDPGRAERLWLILAVATLRRVATAPERLAPTDEMDPASSIPLSKPRRPPRLSVARSGWISLLAQLLRGHPLPTMRLNPGPWPGDHTAPRNLLL